MGSDGGGDDTGGAMSPQPREDCLACRVVGAGTCLGVAAWVAAPAAGGAPRQVRLAAAAVLVGLGLARAAL